MAHTALGACPIAGSAVQNRPAPAGFTDTRLRYRGHAYVRARTALPKPEFERLYLHERRSVEDIATSIGSRPRILAELAGEYGITLRKTGRRVHAVPDRDWLFKQYIVRQRTVGELADEVGVSSPHMSRLANKYRIPIRARGGTQQAPVIDAAAAAVTPTVLHPVLAIVDGWPRLQRFAVAAEHPNLVEAAAELGVSREVVNHQIMRVERDFGGPLLIRATGTRPMTLTPLGAEVLAAIHFMQPRSR
ncbi:helix-turn-helix domain-containing protein [Nocardia asiatica]